MCIDPAADLQSAACCLVGVDRTGPARLRLHDVSVIGDRGDPADASWRSLGVQHTDCKGGKSRFREGFTSKWFLPPCFDSHDWQHTPAVVTRRTMVWSLTPTRQQEQAIIAATATRYRLAVITLVETGVRVGESVALAWGDVDEANQRVRIQEGKTRAARRLVPTSADRRAGVVPGWHRREMPPRTPRSHAATWFILGFSRKVRNRRLHGPEWSCTVPPTPLRQSQRTKPGGGSGGSPQVPLAGGRWGTTAALLLLELRRHAEVGPGRCRTSMEAVALHREADALAIRRGCAARRRRAAGASRRHPVDAPHTRPERSPRRAGHGRPPRRRRRSASPARRRYGRGSGGPV